MSWFLLRWILHSKRFNWSGRKQFFEFCARCSLLWKMAAVTKEKKPPHVFVENLVHLVKPWSRPFLHLMGFFSANGMAQKGSWSRVGHHCHINRQNRRKCCEDWQHTHSEKQDRLLQLLAGFCWKFGEAIGESRGGWNLEKKGGIGEYSSFSLGVLWNFQYNNFCTFL